MSYESPIELLITDIQHQIVEQQDEQIYQAVMNVIPNINREELLRALRYDRQQYDAGYIDGKRFAEENMVHCGECIQWRALSGGFADYGHCHWHSCTKHETGYCDRGDRRSEDDD